MKVTEKIFQHALYSCILEIVSGTDIRYKIVSVDDASQGLVCSANIESAIEKIAQFYVSIGERAPTIDQFVPYKVVMGDGSNFIIKRKGNKYEIAAYANYSCATVVTGLTYQQAVAKANKLHQICISRDDN